MLQRHGLIFLFGLFFSAGLSADALKQPVFHRVNLYLVDQMILPAYENLAARADDLNRSAHEYCSATPQQRRDDVEKNFFRFVDQWMSIQFLSFGPIEYQFRTERIQYWPDKHNVVSKQLRKILTDQNWNMLEPAVFSDTSAGVQGIMALERLLFTQNAAEKKSNAEEDPAFRCALVKAISNNLHQLTTGVVSDWKGEGKFREQIVNVDTGSDFFDTPSEATREILRDLHESLVRISELKLARPLGSSLEKAKPRRAEMWRSDRVLSNILVNLAAITAYFVDKPEVSNLSTLANSAELADRVQRIVALLNSAHKTINDIPMPLETALSNAKHWSSLISARDSLRSAADSIAKLSVELDIPLGFNALDGD